MKHRLVHLDLMRGLAALMVCAGHLRAFLMVNYGETKMHGLGEHIFYFSTGLGRQAVMIFFVLSGYFVGGSVAGAYQAGKWSWQQYAIRRLSRLWIVLLPALMLTLVWDMAGRNLAGAGYNGAFHELYLSGPSPHAPADLRPTTFLGNALFLQTIYVPSFGTNGPLWSLANEFWYYLLFPLALGVFVMKHGVFYRLISGLLVALIIFWLPAGILWGGLVWLLGVGAFALARNEWTQRVCGHPGWLAVTAILAFGSLAASKTSSMFGSNLAIGAAFALFVAGLAVQNSAPQVYAKLADGMGETSYTLYLTHFPFLAFIFFTVFKGEQFQPDLAGFARFFGVLLITLVYVVVVWWCFERNTDRIRKRLETIFRSRSPSSIS
jgi:peptidoglycan/LPS O-acetylase OafA/YrhL